MAEQRKFNLGRGTASRSQQDLSKLVNLPSIGRGSISKNVLGSPSGRGSGRGLGLQSGSSGIGIFSSLTAGASSTASKSMSSSDESSGSHTASLIAALQRMKTSSGVARGRAIIPMGRGISSESDSNAPAVGVLSSTGTAKDSAYLTESQSPTDINENIKQPMLKANLPKIKEAPVIEASVLDAKTSQPITVTVQERNVVTCHGVSGQPVPLHANCVPIKCVNEAVYEYHVSFRPDIDNQNLRYILLNEHRDVIGNTKAFDGSILFLPKKLDSSVTYLQSERLTDHAIVTIKIQILRALHPASPLLIRFYNIVLHRIMKILQLCPVGRNYYDPKVPENIDQYKIVLWPGFVTSIREMEGGLLLNIDVSHKVLRKESVSDVMHEVYMKNKNSFHESCRQELVGSTVLTRYNNKTYRVDDIDFSKTPQSTFQTAKGESISFVKYYKTQYKIDIKDLNQPLLVNRPKTSTKRSKRQEEGQSITLLLVPELCFLTGLSDKIASDFRALKDIGKHTHLSPNDRNRKIVQFINRINTTPEAKEELHRWGLELHSDTCALQGRMFPTEKVLVGDKRVFVCNEEADFSRDVTRNAVIRGVEISSWVLVFVNRDKQKATNFAEKLREVCGKLNIRVNAPQMICLENDRSGTFRNALAPAINPSLQLVVCIFPFSRSDNYNAIKKLCCADMPVPSQVIISKTLPMDAKAGKFRSVTMKIALQINCKLGGELWALEIPLKKLMVCGIDVYHEGKGKGKSVAALVASMNNLLTRWHSRASMQLPQQEIIDALKHCFTDILTKYYEINDYLPDRIILYRDGVGDGQLSQVSNYEVEQLKQSFKMFDKLVGGTYEPKLTVIVVSKRINLKYFQQIGQQMNNPPPGTVLDNTVTRTNWPDFYLVSQHVRQGTVSPTHYVCVNGDAHLKPDHMQRLTYKLTHMYYNWPGTIRVPAPCQYAHKMAYLVGENIGKEPSLNLCDKLFYL